MVSGAREVIWSFRAKKDKREIFKYWNLRNKSTIYSRKLNNFFNEKMKQISINPFLGRRTSVENVRTVIVRNCLLIYEIFDDVILVSGVWEAHQNPDSLSL
ncbi:type II toxin-antitoxin system RelE/ParE family toxin [Epilithonimonas sp. JDS]|uniref:type II toxin-antitoxin system RelE/ParE family toxin n=1 Tax=Epilithonimonas sp. JDS TaxID=2902797 RepID=UPI001E2D9834|nr:type II toxin-antitoxin system RelE/ParE family toxin [Epilithonimonas sp. JDS]MCD9856038.1 type II toxin-antitoxin system RelE/ParE family toxin [Epilithonimonas sp. JDS]